MRILVAGGLARYTMVSRPGADNKKAIRDLGWRPQFVTWQSGFEISKILEKYPRGKDRYLLKLFRVFANSLRFLDKKGVFNLLDVDSPLSLREREIMALCGNYHTISLVASTARIELVSFGLRLAVGNSSI